MTTTLNSENIQIVWRAIDELKPSDKAKITKGDNKLRNTMAERNSFAVGRMQTVLRRYEPIKDAKIEDAKAKRDAIIAAAQAEYQMAHDEAVAEFSAAIKPVCDMHNREWKINYDLYLQEWQELVESVIGRSVL